MRRVFLFRCLFSGLAILFVAAMPLCSQDVPRINEGKFKGFLTFGGHMLIEIAEPYKVREVCGEIKFPGYDLNEEKYGVVFEIRGPGSDMKILATISDKKGHFCIWVVPDGTYLFKTRLLYFQDLWGTIIVSNKANRKNIIRVQMAVAD